MKKLYVKKLGIILAVSISMLSLTACGSQAEETAPATEEAPAADTETDAAADDTQNVETPDTEASGTDTENVTEANTEETTDGETNGELDNFSVDMNTVKDFAQKIQLAVADKSLEELAALMIFPNYVSVYDEQDGNVATSDEFLAIDGSRIFTDELVASIANADLESLQPSMAGFFLTDKDSSDAPGINFSINDGELKITGINY